LSHPVARQNARFIGLTGARRAKSDSRNPLNLWAVLIYSLAHDLPTPATRVTNLTLADLQFDLGPAFDAIFPQKRHREVKRAPKM